MNIISRIFIGFSFLVFCMANTVLVHADTSGVWYVSRYPTIEGDTDTTDAYYSVNDNTVSTLMIKNPKIALSTCNFDMSSVSSNLLECSDKKHVLALKRFFAILKSPYNQSRLLKKLLESQSPGLSYVSALHQDRVLGVFKAGNGYISIHTSHSSFNNLLISYYEINNGKSVVYTQYFEFDPLAKSAQQSFTAEYSSNEEGKEELYTDISKNIEKGKFTDSDMQSYIDAFIVRAKNIKSLIDKIPTGSVYNDKGFLTKQVYYDDNGKVKARPNGIAVTEYTYNDIGDVLIIRTKDADLKLKEDNGVAITRKEYNSNRTLERESYYNKYNELLPKGVAQVSYKYDSVGHIIESSKWNVKGELEASQDLVARYVNEYDKDLQVATYNYDSKGNLVENIEGWAIMQNTYNDKGLLIKIVFLGTDKKLKNNTAGIAIITYEYDDKGQQTNMYHFDARNNPINIQ